jgi:hypothetical protein
VILFLAAQLLRLSTAINRCGLLEVDEKVIPNSKVMIADSYVQKRVGLLNHSTLHQGEGLMIRGTKSVHTLGMLFPIDLVFLNRSGEVLYTLEHVLPENKKLIGPQMTQNVMELSAGSIAKYKIRLAGTVKVRA